MNKLETAMCEAMLDGKPFRTRNTSVAIRKTPEGEFHSAVVYFNVSEICHYFWSGEEETWVVRLRDALIRTDTTLSRLNAILEGVGGSPARIYDTGERNDLGQPIWNYKMGPNTYKWDQGTATFFAKPPRVSPSGGRK